MADEKPVIIVKKKGGHGGHHGGAWKVAYADLVTSMMAFFMVMWLVNSAEVNTKQNIARYFRRPGIFSEGSGSPLLLGGAGILLESHAPDKPNKNDGTGKADLKTERVEEVKPVQRGELPEWKIRNREEGGIGVAPVPQVKVTPAPQAEITPFDEYDDIPTPTPGYGGTGMDGQGQGPLETAGQSGEAKAAGELEQQAFDAVAQELQAKVTASPELRELLGSVNVNMEADGLHVEIMDTDKSSMFSSGSAQVAAQAREAFVQLAGLLGQLPNRMEVIGHTDAKPYATRLNGYSNWELSVDRANSARKLLEAGGISGDRIVSVVGKADKELLKTEDPFAPQNRRISLKVKFDFNGRVNLAKDPQALSNLDKYRQIVRPATPASQPAQKAPAPVPAATPAPQRLTTEEILQKSSKESGKKIYLPGRKSVPTANPDYMPKDKIFSDKPVFGPTGAFSDY